MTSSCSEARVPIKEMGTSAPDKALSWQWRRLQAAVRMDAGRAALGVCPRKAMTFSVVRSCGMWYFPRSRCSCGQAQTSDSCVAQFASAPLMLSSSAAQERNGGEL